MSDISIKQAGVRERIASWLVIVRERPDRLRLFVTGLLAVLVAVQIARLLWIALAPVTVPAAPAAGVAARAADTTVFERFDAFFRTGSASAFADATAATDGSFRLFGVRADPNGGGSAIIGTSDGRQASYAVGEEVEPGLKLQSVGPDFVTLARGSSVMRLAFADAPLNAATPPPPPSTEQVIAPPPSAPAEAAAVTVDPARLADQASLRPRLQGLAIKGFTVQARGSGDVLRAAGLQSGDVILAVNGVELNSPQAALSLKDSLASAPSAQIRFERAGQVRTVTVRTAP